MREYDKMIAGRLYNALDPELAAMRKRARLVLDRINISSADIPSNDERSRHLKELFGSMGLNLWLQPPFFCDYGKNIHLGDDVFFNFNCVVLDVARVDIGSRVLFGPHVQIYTATHPLEAEERRKGLEAGKPVTIGNDVWVGGSAVICPGVKIGEGSVIAAGAVITKDIPSGVIAAGNPARIIRSVEKSSP